jgi:hypothetical protein
MYCDLGDFFLFFSLSKGRKKKGQSKFWASAVSSQMGITQMGKSLKTDLSLPCPYKSDS